MGKENERLLSSRALTAISLSYVLVLELISITIPGRAADSFSFTTIDAPEAYGWTSARGINGAGEIVGDFGEANGRQHGFLRSATGTFTTIDVPGTTNTTAYGINDAGQIVGDFQDRPPKVHGFVTTQ